MDKIYNLFKKFLPTIILLSLLGLAFGFMTLMYYYNDAIPSVYYKNVIPIFTILFFVAAIAVSILFVAKTTSLDIKRVKKDSGFSKFATLLAAVMAATLFFFDFFRFVQTPSIFSPLRIIRLIAFIPFVAYLVIQVIPRKYKHKPIVLPKWLKPVSAVSAIVWCVLGLMILYFWEELPTTNMFKLIYIVYYILATLFFLCEAKFELLKPNHRLYMITALFLFVFTSIFSGSVFIAKLLGRTPSITISEFEIILSATLGLYALSKMIAVAKTLKYVMERHSDSRHGRHHSRKHHHSSEASSESTNNEVKENN